MSSNKIVKGIIRIIKITNPCQLTMELYIFLNLNKEKSSRKQY